MTKIIETKKLTKFYGKARGIENVNLEVAPGEIFGFIGPNGAGKSTTIRTLLGLVKKTSGEGQIFGQDIEKNHAEILASVGYLPSEVFYYDKMRAIDLFKYSMSFYKKDCMDKITTLAETLSLDVSRKIEDLSLGNKKKVGIIQGLLHSPKLIILDEPTTGLDPLMQHKFFSILKEENEKGATILFSSHILSEVQKICSKVAIIKDGTIVKNESLSNLKNLSYKKINLKTREKLDLKDLSVTELKEEGENVSFVFSGNLQKLFGVLSAHEVEDVAIADPSLEEVFESYYK